MGWGGVGWDGDGDETVVMWAGIGLLLGVGRDVMGGLGWDGGIRSRSLQLRAPSYQLSYRLCAVSSVAGGSLR